MTKKKKIILYSILIILLLIGIGLGIFYFYRLNKIVSVLTIDINPSIRVSLNYKNEVIKTEGLNDDGELLLKDNNFNGNSLETTIKNITAIVIEKGYITEEDNHILINVEGEDIADEVVTSFKNEFKNKNTECNVVIQEINEKAKENADKYGISESKASYIEEIIKDYSDIKFEDLKDKSINEIDQTIKEVEESKEEQKKDEIKIEEPNTNNNSNSNNIQNYPPSSTVLNIPANDDRTGAWCDFIASLPPEGGVDFETPGKITGMEKFYEVAKNYIQDELDWANNFGGSDGGWYRTASYCSAAVVNVENAAKDRKYQVFIDSVTLEVLELKVIEIEKPKISEEAARAIARKWAQDTYGIDVDNCEAPFYSLYYSIDGVTNIPEWQYSTKCLNPEIKYFAVNINALTGELTNGRTWGANGF